MSKINILVVPSDKYGAGKFRSLDPHINLNTEEYQVEINYKPDYNDIEYMKQFQIIHIHRLIVDRFWETDIIIKQMQALGIKVVMDTDDYWHLHTLHPNYGPSIKYEISKHIINGFRAADLVTVPTQFVANELIKIGIKHVVVLPNGINPNEQQFVPEPKEHDKLRVGILCGSSHLEDVALIKGVGYHNQPYQTVICGFDMSGTVSYKDPADGENKVRDISPLETVWFLYEMLLTDGHKSINSDKEYYEYMVKFENTPYNDIDKPYRRIFTRNVSSYAKGYNDLDVLLAPLKDNKFNLYKSPLKIIEAGFMKKVIIASNYGPYTEDLVNGKNCLLVDTNKDHKQWRKHVQTLVDNPNMVIDLSEALHETVKDKYNLINITETRSSIYKKLINV